MSLKQDRAAELIRGILSDLLLREVSDPRLQGVTITDVRLDGELVFADIYVNALGDESRREEVLHGLKSANGFLRRQVGKRIRLRSTPELHFHWDVTLERGEHLQQLIENLEISPEAVEDIEDSGKDDKLG
jgi:ribosome-binding factor A